MMDRRVSRPLESETADALGSGTGNPIAGSNPSHIDSVYPPDKNQGSADALDASQRVLIVDDEAEIRWICRSALEREGIVCDEAADGFQALRAASNSRFDLVLLDMAMPGMTGYELCQRFRRQASTADLRIIMFSGHMSADDLSRMLALGADDFLTKPFSVVQLTARVRAALRSKSNQDRAFQWSDQLVQANQALANDLQARNRDVSDAHQALVLAMAKLVECRDTETGGHLRRLQTYCRCLGEEAASLPRFTRQIDDAFVRRLEWSAPLHDIGKAGIPDRILQKQGPLTPAERSIMETHTIVGAETLHQVADRHGSGMGFLRMAIDIARHHHERFDGMGYPDRLDGEKIPLPARLLAIADVYDALRSRRPYKPAYAHAATVDTMLNHSDGQFDPDLMHAFERSAPKFERIFREGADEPAALSSGC